MRFLLLVHADAADWETPDDQAAQDGIAVRAAAIARLHAAGHLIACSPLTDLAAAVEVRVRDGNTHATSPPPAPDPIAGFYLIEAPGLASAVELAASIPDSHTAHLTIRPLLGLSGIPDHVPPVLHGGDNG